MVCGVRGSSLKGVCFTQMLSQYKPQDDKCFMRATIVTNKKAITLHEMLPPQQSSNCLQWGRLEIAKEATTVGQIYSPLEITQA